MKPPFRGKTPEMSMTKTKPGFKMPCFTALCAYVMALNPSGGPPGWPPKEGQRRERRDEISTVSSSHFSLSLSHFLRHCSDFIFTLIHAFFDRTFDLYPTFI